MYQKINIEGKGSAIKNQVNRLLRKALKEGRLVGRKTYHEFYDSAHDPIERPDAPFKPVSFRQGLDSGEVMTIPQDQLKARYTVYYSISEDGQTIKASLFYGNVKEEFRILESAETPIEEPRPKTYAEEIQDNVLTLKSN